jgi:hypothetical protein
MDTNDATGFEAYSGESCPRSCKRQRDVVLHVARTEKKTWNYNNPIVALRNRVEFVGKRRYGELDVPMPHIELRSARPNVRDKLLEL